MSYGRTKIYSDAKEITAANAVEEVSNAYSLHCRNQADIKALWDCYRGKTKILHKTKEIREEINHKINFFFSTNLPLYLQPFRKQCYHHIRKYIVSRYNYPITYRRIMI